MRRNGTYSGTWAVRIFVAALLTGVTDSAVSPCLRYRQAADNAMLQRQARTQQYQYCCMSSATDPPPHLLLLPHTDRDVPRAGQGPAVLHRLRHHLVRPCPGTMLVLEAACIWARACHSVRLRLATDYFLFDLLRSPWISSYLTRKRALYNDMNRCELPAAASDAVAVFS